MIVDFGPDHVDALEELVNIGVGRAAGVLNHMLASHVRVQVPEVRMVGPGEALALLEAIGDDRLATVGQSFDGSFSGVAGLVIPPEPASRLFALLTGSAPGGDDHDGMRSGTLSEVGNIVLNSVMGSISNVLGGHLDYGLPSFTEAPPAEVLAVLLPASGAEGLVACTARFDVAAHVIHGDVILVFSSGSLARLRGAIEAVAVGA